MAFMNAVHNRLRNRVESISLQPIDLFVGASVALRGETIEPAVMVKYIDAVAGKFELSGKAKRMLNSRVVATIMGKGNFAAGLAVMIARYRGYERSEEAEFAVETFVEILEGMGSDRTKINDHVLGWVTTAHYDDDEFHTREFLPRLVSRLGLGADNAAELIVMVGVKYCPDKTARLVKEFPDPIKLMTEFARRKPGAVAEVAAHLSIEFGHDANATGEFAAKLWEEWGGWHHKSSFRQFAERIADVRDFNEAQTGEFAVAFSRTSYTERKDQENFVGELKASRKKTIEKAETEFLADLVAVNKE